ncbi:MAG: alpha/beta fold hydrolase [Ilumatobacteraceae bacterium]
MTAPRPVLLVHGWAGSFAHTWERSGVVELLREAGRTVVAYDLPGHGSATKPHDPTQYADLAGHLLAHVEQHGSLSVDAVGFSLGAITLLRAVSRTPDAFGTVILAGIGDGVFSPHDPSRSERILAGLEGRAEPGDVTARIFGKIGNEAHNDVRALAAVLRRPREEPLTHESLTAITNPVIVALGDQDFSGPATRLSAALPNARLVTLKGIAHFRTPESLDFIDLVVNTFS